MRAKETSMLGRIRHNVRNRIVSGIFVVIPVVITGYVLQIILAAVSTSISPLIREVFGQLPRVAITLLSVIALFIGLYIIGAVTANVVAKRVIGHSENFLRHIPILSTVYHTTKQVIDTLASTDDTRTKSVVMVEYPKAGIWSLGFKTGSVTCPKRGRLIKVLIPTSPNPTSGFLVFIPENDVIETIISMEDGMKVIISGGILMPDMLPERQQPS